MAAFFHPSLSQCHFSTELYSRPLKISYLKLTQTPNMLGTKVSDFMQQQNHFMQNNKTVHGKHKKSIKYTTTLWGPHTFLRKTRCIHHNINVSTIGNLHLKSGSTLQKCPRQGVNNTPFWQQSHFMRTIRLHSSWYIHKRYETHQHCEVRTPFSAKHHADITSTYPLQETFT